MNYYKEKQILSKDTSKAAYLQLKCWSIFLIELFHLTIQNLKYLSIVIGEINTFQVQNFSPSDVEETGAEDVDVSCSSLDTKT